MNTRNPGFLFLLFCFFLFPAAKLPAYEALLEVGNNSQNTLEPVTVNVKEFIVSGNTVVSDNSIMKVLKPFVGRRLTLDELKQAADQVTSLFFQRGYITSYAWLPEQDVQNGTIAIKVSEGSAGNVLVQNNRSYRGSFIRNHFLAAVKDGKALDNRKIERAAMLLNDYPNLAVKANLEPSAEKDKTDLRIEVTEKVPAPVSGSVFFSNHGTRYTGFNRLGANWTLANFTQNADFLDMTLMMSPNHESWRNMLYGKASYNLPIGYHGTRLSLGLELGSYDLGGRLKPLGIVGNSNVINFSLCHPVFRGRERNLYVSGGISRKDHKNYLFERTLNTSADLYSVFQAALHGDSVHGKCALAWSLQLGCGLGDAFGGMDDGDYINSSRPNNADGSWTKINLALNGTIHCRNEQRLILRCESQFSKDSLLSPEQATLGGPNSVRAYPVSEYSGDRSFLLSAEYHLPFHRKEKATTDAGWLVFVDHGETRINNRLAGERNGRLTGAGVGLRFAFAHNLTLNFDAAFPMCDEDASDGDHARFWLSLSQPF